MNERLSRLRKKIKNLDVDSMLISSLHNIRWLTGYSGSNGLAAVSARNAYFLTDFRYTGQAQKETKNSGFNLHIANRDLYTSLGDIKPSVFGKTVGFESDNLTATNFKKVKSALKEKRLKAVSDVIFELRMVKDRSELAKLRRAAQLTDGAFAAALPLVRPGVMESVLMSEIEYFFHKNGGYASFETIVASGYRSALPHGRASTKKIKKGEFVTFDLGGVYDGYTADMTRTVVVGKATDKQKKIYNLVLEAHLAGIDAVKPGAMACDIDAIARNIISAGGYGEYFGHALGHGIGIVVQGDRIHIHEGPVLAARSKTILEEGMVVTVEPGIYIPRWGGVRIEDDVVVTARGCSILNKSPKSLLEL